MVRRRALTPLLGVLLVGVSFSSSPNVPPGAARPDAPAPAAPEEPAKLLQTPDDAVRAALADAALLPPYDLPFTRYLWVPDGDKRSLRTASLALNYVSRASAIYRPFPAAAGHLIRVDLRMYAPRDNDLKEWLGLWEELSFDPAFSLLITRDTVDFVGKELLESIPRRTLRTTVTRTRKVKKSAQEKDSQGRPLYWAGDRSRPVLIEIEVEERYEEQVEKRVFPLESGFDVVRVNAPHIDPVRYARLQLLLGTTAPVVEHRYFKTRVLTTIKDKKVFAQVFGGLYYDFRGVKKAQDVLGKDTKATDLDLYFENLGIGNIKAGETADKLFDRLRSDQRLAVFRSGVTGKPREVSMFHTPADKEGGGWGAITGDIKDGDIDIGDRSYANLLNPRRAARESIFPAANGFPVFGLFNDKGALQDEVPPDVAVDFTIPAPHTRRLQAAIGCIRCHGTDGSDGWKPLTNDVKKLLKELDLFGDLSDKGFRATGVNYDVLDRLAGLYAGNFDKNLRRARDDMAEVTLRATGPWDESQDQADAAKVASTRLSDEYSGYNYDLIDAHEALKELGLQVPKAQAAAYFKALLPPDLRADVGVGYIPEDPRIGALRAGLSINRADWSLAYSFAADRGKARLRQLAEKRK